MVVLVHGACAASPGASFRATTFTPPVVLAITRPSRQHRRARKAAIREHINQHLIHSQLGARLRVSTGRPCPRHEARLSQTLIGPCHLQVRPLASTGNLGINAAGSPDLPDADR